MPLKRAVKGVGSRYTEEKKKSSAYTCNTYLSASMCTLCYPIDFGAVCVCTQGMFVCLLWCGPKPNNSTRREIWTVQSKIYICTLLRVFGRMVGRSWSHWRRLAGFFFSLSNSTRRPFDTWDNWHDLPYVCVKKQRVTLFFCLASFLLDSDSFAAAGVYNIV